MWFIVFITLSAVALMLSCYPVDREKLNDLGKPFHFSFNGMKAYFSEYQYMGNSNPDPSIQQESKDDPDAAFINAVSLFQSFNGLETTGEMDNKTLKLMATPRCGNPDIIAEADITGSKRRQKRFVEHEGGPWNKTHFTYKIVNKPIPFMKSICLGSSCQGSSSSGGFLKPLSQRVTNRAINKAFSAWSKITDSMLTFKNVNRGSADITLKFNHKNHAPEFPGDRNHDGPGGNLAHASWPITSKSGGFIHFDDNEIWTLKSGLAADLFQVTAHEIGHVLGLGHSKKKSAVMYSYFTYKRKWRFDQDDMNGINHLYQPDAVLQLKQAPPRKFM